MFQHLCDDIILLNSSNLILNWDLTNINLLVNRISNIKTNLASLR